MINKNYECGFLDNENKLEDLKKEFSERFKESEPFYSIENFIEDKIKEDYRFKDLETTHKDLRNWFYIRLFKKGFGITNAYENKEIVDNYKEGENE